MKKALCILLSLILAISILPAAAASEPIELYDLYALYDELFSRCMDGDTEMTINTDLFNNSDVAATLTKIVYSIGDTSIGENTESQEIAAGGTLTVPFSYTPDAAGSVTVNVKAFMTIDGQEYPAVIPLRLRDIDHINE